MFTDLNEVLRARISEEINPLLRVKSRGGEIGDEVVVDNVRAVRLEVVLVGFRGVIGLVELPPVPFGVGFFVALVSPGGDGVDAPVDEDAEFGVVVPIQKLGE